MKYILYIISIVIAFSCANVQAPTGGPKDLKAPVAYRSQSSPDSINITNYDKQYIELVFDEYVKDKNLFQELIITPPLKGNYKTDIFKNKLKLEFEEPLDSNTTYTFNFGKGVVDAHEGNPVENLIIALSTGSYIDSLEIEGTVVDNFTNKITEKILVAIYDVNDTLNFIEDKPNYFCFSDAEGNFKFQYLKPGEYSIVAIEDINNNYLYNANEEKIAIAENTIKLDSNTKDIDLRLFKENKQELRISSIKNKQESIFIEFNKKIKSIELNSSDSITYELKNNNSMQLYNAYLKTDSISIDIVAVDSLENKIDSTFKVIFTKPRKPIKEKFSTTFVNANKGYVIDSSEFTITFSIPVKEMLTDSIFEITSTDTIPIQQIKDLSYSWNQYNSKLTFERINNTEEMYSYKFKPTAFISILNDTSTQRSHSIKKLDEKEYGILKGVINTETESYIVQLLNKNYEVIKEAKNIKTFHYEYIKPDSYTFRILIDENNNGVYDKGDVEKLTIPEPIHFFNEEIKLKANWELNDINLTF